MGALSLVVLAVLLAVQGTQSATNGLFLGKKTTVAPPAGQLTASLAVDSGLSSSMSAMTVSSPMYSFPTYPAVNDYASGTCAGYAFCFAAWNPPVVTEPDVMCPAGYELTNQQLSPICVQKMAAACPAGFDFSSNGDCCTVRASGQCYANWDSCSGGAASAGSYMYSGDVGVGSICKGTPDYSAVVDGVQLVQVTSGSKWFDGGANHNTAGVSQGYGYGNAANNGVDSTSVQVIPSGQLVNLNGQLVHVGPLPAGVPLAGDGGSSSSSSSSSSSTGGGGTGGGGTDGSGLSAAQQAALDALQRQAQQQGTYIPGQTAGAAAGGSSSSSSSSGSSSAGSNLPLPTLSGQQAALDALQQQAQQQGTYIPGQGSTGSNAGSNTGSNAGSNAGLSAGSNAAAAGSNAAPRSSFDLPPLQQPVVSGSSGSAAARLAGKAPKEGLLLTTVLLLLPKILLASSGMRLSFSATVPKVIADELVATKEVMASLMNKKEDFLPKCFSKCCTPDADVVCVPSSTSVNYAKPAYLCPPGCTFLDNSNKCLCSSAHFTPCSPTDTVCSWGDQPICVGSKSFFGIEACAFVGAMQQYLPKVQCPYKSLANGLAYQQLG